MSNFGFNGISGENALSQLLKQYTQQPESSQNDEARRANNAAPYEIGSQSELEYIVPDKSGRKQIVDCPSENKVYVGRYNHVRQVMDWRSYIDEGEIRLSQKADTSAEMSQIAEALVAVARTLEVMQSGIDTMHGEIQELKNNTPASAEPKAEPKREKTSRRSNGQFKKKDE